MARWLAVYGVTLLLGGSLTYAQAAQSGPQPPGFTLQANTRVVLTDVTVIDGKGQPVHGLKAADFRISDNNQPQTIASFEEHRKDRATPWVEPVATPGVYNNDYIAHPPAVMNVMLLDLTNLSIEDQMYLNVQLGKFLDALKPEDPIALYARTGPACILLQGFTSDRGLLRAAVHKALPRFPPEGRESLSDVETMQQIEQYLAQIPGRKNVLWFSGGSTLYLRPDATQLENYRQRQAVYDDLEANRIAVYPIDARGLALYGGSTLNAQHGQMKDVAEATGGRALYDNNGLAKFASQTIDQDGEYYTLTYTPQDFKYDNKWHKVRVTVPGVNYALSYRRGYFGDANTQEERQPKRTRTRLLAGGRTADEKPEMHEPIVFQASVVAGTMANRADGQTFIVPAESKHGASSFVVRYQLPLEAFKIALQNGRPTVQCGAAVLVFSSNGTLLAHQVQKITFTLKDAAARQPAGGWLPIDEPIELGKGDVYLYVAAWDILSGRLGTLQIPYHVAAPGKTKPISNGR